MNFVKLLFSVLCFFLLISCEKNEGPQNDNNSERTIIVYMIASNNLGSNNFDKKDIEEMEKAVSSCDMNNCRLLVYHVTYDSNPILFEIRKDRNTISRNILKTYNSDSSVTSDRMRTVFKDVATFAPAKEYGLILWSHASGWPLSLPQEGIKLKDYKSNLPLYRNFGQDRGRSMTITELSQAIDNNFFNFIYCDVCYMGSIEVAYQLRNKTKYFIASPTLLPADGMPYDLNIPEFVKNRPDLRQACENTYNYYNRLSGVNKTLTIGLIDCSALERLAATCKKLNSHGFNYNINDLQGYIIKDEAKCIFFDFGQYYNTSLSEDIVNDFNKELEQCILYKASTDYIFDKLKISKDKFSGLSTYILNTSNKANDEYYRTLDWYNDVY